MKSLERICGICCYLIELSHDKAKLPEHVIQVLIHFRHSKPREDYHHLNTVPGSPVGQPLHLVVHAAQVPVVLAGELLSGCFHLIKHWT